VITSVERRPRWSRSEEERIVAAALEPGAVASAVAREAGIHAGQLYRWRQERCGPTRGGGGLRCGDDCGGAERAAQPEVGANWR
jgi:transposase-like protein